MNDYFEPLQPERYFHLFNHAVGDEFLFKEERNYEFFLLKWKLFTAPICETHCYNLMPDHFHIVIQIRSLKDCLDYFEIKKGIQFIEGQHNLSDFLMERFSNLFNSYAKSYNKVYNRKGALFMDYVKRTEIINTRELKNVINYVHFNAWHHGFCENYFDWKWTSVHSILCKEYRSRSKEKVLKLFDGIENFIKAHSAMVRFRGEYEFLTGEVARNV